MRNWINLISAPRVLYHYTSRDHRDSIFKNGLSSETSEVVGDQVGGIFLSDAYRNPETHAIDVWEVDTLGLPLVRDGTDRAHLDEKWYVDWESDDSIPPDRLNLLSDRIMENKAITEGRISKISIRSGLPFTVYRDPTSTQIFNSRIDEFRGIIEGEKGNMYVWDSYDGTHQSVAKELAVSIHMQFTVSGNVISGDIYATDNEKFIRAFGSDILPDIDEEDLEESAINYELAEAPISDISYIGDWDKNSSYGTQDRKLLTAPKAVAKIKSMWKYPEDVDFNILLINNAEARKWTEEGIVDRDKLATMFPKTITEIEPLIRSDQVNILYTNNKGAERVPMTGWIMAHRYGHALMRGGKSHYFKEAHETLDRYLADLMVSYGVRGNSSQSRFSSGYLSKTPTLENPITIKLAQEIFTFRSAREKNLRNSHEALHELFAQYIITGQITVNPLPRRFKWKTSYYGYKLTDDDYKQDCNTIEHDLPYELISYFETAIHGSVGKILVM